MLKKIYLLLVVIISLIFVNGCDMDKSKYNVEIIKDGYNFIEGYLEERIPSNSINDKIPKDYTIVIMNDNELKTIFKKFKKIDFNEQMVIVYIYNSIYTSDVKITELDYDNDGELSIEFKHKTKNGTGSATAPRQGVLIIVMDKLYITEIDIEQD